VAEGGGGATDALEAADKFLSSVIMNAHNFMNPNASPCSKNYQDRDNEVILQDFQCIVREHTSTR
jgi:hypothetical protein